jgi:LPS-assembly protein
MVRWLILCVIGLAGAVQAEGAQDTAGSTPRGEASGPGLGESPTLRTSPRLGIHRPVDEEIPAYLEADQIEGDPNNELTLIRNAQVRRIDAILKGDRINYRKNDGEIEVLGSGRLLREGNLITGPRINYNVDKDTGEIDSPNFWIGASNGFARAEHASIFSRSQMRLTTVTYSGCLCDNPSWYIKADRVDLDLDENEGVARNGVLYFKDVPILASPYFTFPIKEERKSGFLLPTYGTSSRAGFAMSAPYYFNLAPNYDLTLTPRYMSKRGTQLGGEFRYLGANYSGTVSGTYMNNDHQAGQNRWMYWSQHQQKLGNGFYMDWDLAAVSDDNYFRDFSSLGLNEASTTYLPRRGRVGWSGNYWQAYAQIYKYQTLQDPQAPLVPPYDKVPQFTLIGHRYDWGGFDAEWETNAVTFRQPLFLGQRYGPDGDRLSSYPTISYPIIRPGWYIIPKVGVHFAQYQTDWYNLPQYMGRPRSQSRVVPISSLDAGMVFEREATLFGKASTQTLEPRLYYLRVPYRDQSELPVYDTSLANFDFSQVFEENIYSGGWDRIADANQITAALTTRWLDAETRLERLSLAAAQRIYFNNQRTTLPNETPRANIRSDFLVAASAALTDTLSTSLTAQYNPYNDSWSRATIAGRWAPQRLTTVSLAYRYQRDPPSGVSYQPQGQNQVSLGVQWPFTKRWYGVGRIDYSLRSTEGEPIINESPRITQAIAGLEYKGDSCWTGRVVFQKYAISSTSNNTALFLQLELKGLGGLGTDPIALLYRSIPGYQPINPPAPPGSPFERYE